MILALSNLGSILFFLFLVLPVIYVLVMGLFIVRVSWWRVREGKLVKKIQKKIVKAGTPFLLVTPFLIPLSVVALCEVLGG